MPIVIKLLLKYNLSICNWKFFTISGSILGPSLGTAFWGPLLQTLPKLKSASAQEVLEAEVKTCEPPAELSLKSGFCKRLGSVTWIDG